MALDAWATVYGNLELPSVLTPTALRLASMIPSECSGALAASFDAADTALALLPLVAAWMAAVEFDEARMAEAAQSGFMNAWAAATYLVSRGVPSRLAHEQIGKVVKLCLDIHDVIGGTAPARVRQAIAAARQTIGALREEVKIHAHA